MEVAVPTIHGHIQPSLLAIPLEQLSMQVMGHAFQDAEFYYVV